MKIEVCKGQAGLALYVDDKRVAGPRHNGVMKTILSATVAADALATKDTTLSETVMRFAQAILHGDDEHKAWLLEAATAFNAGEPLPPPNGKGRAEAAEASLSEMRVELERARKALEPFGRYAAITYAPVNIRDEKVELGIYASNATAEVTVGDFRAALALSSQADGVRSLSGEEKL